MDPSTNGLSSRRCSICLEMVSEDNKRGKAELICGHLFHLACIGTEFNYRKEMKCPNCRVVERGEWRQSPEDESDDDERLHIHFYSHNVGDNTSTTRGQNVISPTIHYHQQTVVLSPPSQSSQPARGNTTEYFLNPSGMTSGWPQYRPDVNVSAQQARFMGYSAEELRALHYYAFQQTRNYFERPSEPTNPARAQSSAAHDGVDPSTQVGVGAGSGENEGGRVAGEQQDGNNGRLDDGANEGS